MSLGGMGESVRVSSFPVVRDNNKQKCDGLNSLQQAHSKQLVSQSSDAVGKYSLGPKCSF